MKPHVPGDLAELCPRPGCGDRGVIVWADDWNVTHELGEGRHGELVVVLEVDTSKNLDNVRVLTRFGVGRILQDRVRRTGEL